MFARKLTACFQSFKVAQKQTNKQTKVRFNKDSSFNCQQPDAKTSGLFFLLGYVIIIMNILMLNLNLFCEHALNVKVKPLQSLNLRFNGTHRVQ